MLSYDARRRLAESNPPLLLFVLRLVLVEAPGLFQKYGFRSDHDYSVADWKRLPLQISVLREIAGDCVLQSCLRVIRVRGVPHDSGLITAGPRDVAGPKRRDRRNNAW